MAVGVSQVTARRPCASKVQRLRMVWAAVRDNIDTDAKMARQVIDHSFGGGKGARAFVAHVSTDWCGMTGEACSLIAAAMEMIHVASLLHDDVVDEASVRRHKPSANKRFGEQAAVLAGDFLYSRASQLLSEHGTMGLLREIADTTNLLAEGELLQHANNGKVTDEDEYYGVIRRKTAALFSASALAGPLATGTTAMVEPLREYGLRLGLAFQIMDDCLDYMGETSHIGKGTGVDFHGGKVTLPFLRAMRLGNRRQKEVLRKAFAERGKESAHAAVREVIAATDTIMSVKQDAGTNVAMALEALAGLPDGGHKEMLGHFARQSLRRSK